MGVMSTKTTDPRRVILGPTVRALRQALGIKQSDFALRCGITPGYLNNIEAARRQPAPDVAVSIARELGVTLDAVTYVDRGAA